jgi:hypothetical protein
MCFSAVHWNFAQKRHVSGSDKHLLAAVEAGSAPPPPKLHETVSEAQVDSLFKGNVPHHD